jgi:hypothetical protein
MQSLLLHAVLIANNGAEHSFSRVGRWRGPLPTIPIREKPARTLKNHRKIRLAKAKPATGNADVPRRNQNVLASAALSMRPCTCSYALNNKLAQ